MPGKNSIKEYVEGGYYHVYNRGVEKRAIFLDEQDYNVFLSYLKEYLLPKDEKELQQRISDPTASNKEKDKIRKLLQLNNFNQEITLLAYCLMPNHFHLFIKQRGSVAIDKFMNSLGTRYTMYFNRKYKRVGALYQDVYKAVLISSEVQFLHLSRYIHKQALAPKNQPSSYSEYTDLRKALWVHPEEVLSYFSKINPFLSYESFVAEPDNLVVLENLNLDDEL